MPLGWAASRLSSVEPQLLRELADRGVALVDQLAAVLGDLAAGERAAIDQQRPPRRSEASWSSLA